MEEELKSISELSFDTGFSKSYMYAVKKAARHLFVAGRARQSEVENWLKDNPDFTKHKPYVVSCNFSKKSVS